MNKETQDEKVDVTTNDGAVNTAKVSTQKEVDTTTNDAAISSAEHKQESPQLLFKENELCDLPEEEEEETCNISNEHDHLAVHRRQEERMVLEAGSKAAEIAKNIFGEIYTLISLCITMLFHRKVTQ